MALQPNQQNSKRYAAICFAALFFLVFAYGLLLYSNTDRQLSYYVAALQFRTILVVGGIAIGFLFYYLFIRPLVAPLINTNTPVWPFKIGFVGGWLCVALLTGVFINSHYSRLSYCKKFKIDDKYKGQRYASATYISVTVEDKSLDLNCNPAYWKGISVTDSVNLCIRKGCLGYEYVFFANTDTPNK